MRPGLLGHVWRVLAWVIADSLIVAASFIGSYFLRFLDTPHPAGSADSVTVLLTIGLISVGYALVNIAFRLHRRAWRYAAGIEMLPIVMATVVSAGAALAFDLLHPGMSARPLPVSVVLIGSLLSTIGFAVFRYRTLIWPALNVFPRPAAKPTGQPTRAVVYGAGELGQLLVRRLKTHADGPGYKIVGFLDDDPHKHGLTVHGIKVVGGRGVLRDFVARESVEVIVLAIGSPSGNDVRDILVLARSTAAQIKVAQDVANWMGDRYSEVLLRDMRAEDLIGRQATVLDDERSGTLVIGKTVLVTGASGSIGSELIRQIRMRKPSRIVAVDVNESGLYDLLVEARAVTPDVDLHIVVGDVTNRPRMLDLIRTERPDVIFHVAAYKHVPLMEEYPAEAVWTNVWGTWVVTDAARQCHCGHVVLVSTDKAVNPSSVMGATKRMAEILMHRWRGAGTNGHGTGGPHMTVVRFGNVLGTRGSVIPTFERQIELGGTVTVTHPDMTRYFMHPEEAAALTVEAASLSTNDDIFMLDMGDRVRIDDLAHRMIRLRGLRPNVDVQIKYTGLRPGEKLHEELIYRNERRVDTAHPRVFRIASPASSSTLDAQLEGVVQQFLSGVIDRQVFTAQLVDVASGLVADSRQVETEVESIGEVAVGRLHTTVTEGGAFG